MNENNKKLLFEKEIKTEIRSIRYIFSLIISNGILFICVLYYLNNVLGDSAGGYSSDYKLLLGMYNIMILLHYIMLLFVVPFVASNTLAKEYETNTMDLLLLTNLTTRDIIDIKIKKLLIVNAIYVFSSLPLFAVAFSVGAVSLFSIVSYMVFAMCSSMCYGCVGVYVSAKTQKVTLAALTTCVIELIASLGGYIIFGYVLNFIEDLFNVKINELLWIPLGAFLQVLISFYIIKKIKQFMHHRHYK